MKIGTMPLSPVNTLLRKPPLVGRVLWVKQGDGRWQKVEITEIKEGNAFGVLYFASMV